jgi:hypothetical protein
MGTTNKTAIGSNIDDTESATSPIGTEAIATLLQSIGFGVDYQPGRATNVASKNPVAFIELQASQEDIDKIEECVKKVETAVPHRIIKPSDTSALPDWTDSSDQRPVLIIPSSGATVTQKEKAQAEANFM